MAVPLKLTVEPGVVTAAVGLMLTVGGSSTVIVWWKVAVWPASLVTVSVTVIVPARGVGMGRGRGALASDRVLPSPKFQL